MIQMTLLFTILFSIQGKKHRKIVSLGKKGVSTLGREKVSKTRNPKGVSGYPWLPPPLLPIQCYPPTPILYIHTNTRTYAPGPGVRWGKWGAQGAPESLLFLNCAPQALCFSHLHLSSDIQMHQCLSKPLALFKYEEWVGEREKMKIRDKQLSLASEKTKSSGGEEGSGGRGCKPKAGGKQYKEELVKL